MLGICMMADRELAFSTFLKLLELPEPQKKTTLRGFLRGGGFNYWRPLQNLASEVVGGELKLGDMQEKVGLMARGHQRKYNDRALTNLLKWAGRRRIQLRKRPEKIVRKFGNTGLRIRLQPEVAFAMGGRSYLMHIWATNNPTLSEETLSMGLYFFRRHFQETGQPDTQYLIFDTVKDRIIAEFNILDSAATMLTQHRDLLSNLWSSVNGEDESPPASRPGDRPPERPDDRPFGP